MATTRRTFAALAAAVLVAAAAAAIWFGRGPDGSPAPPARQLQQQQQPGEQQAAPRSTQTSSVLRRGARWTVTVRQSDGVAAHPTGATYKSTYRFHVEQAAATPRDYWMVRAHMLGAEGPFAQGYRLYYLKQRQRGKEVMVLKRVGLADQKPVGLEYAPLVLGQDFPLDKRLSARPRSHSR